MRTRVRAAALAAVIGLVVVVAGGAPAAATAPPSAHCHVVDGAFGACPDGSSEWSDVPAHFFAATNAYLYADEADLDPALASPHSPADTFELMYDECARTTPLGPNEYFLISFDTVEEEGGHSDLVRYNVHVFRDGTIRFFENGEPVADPAGHLRAHEIEGQHGRAAFGPSPHCAADHLTVEYEIALTATGIRLNGGYSPDPIFWGATPPKQPPVANDDEKELPESDDSVTVPVTANDTDADGSVDPSTVTIVTPPQHGTAVANGDGSVLFTKDDSFKHADSFTYTVADNDGLRSNAARVDITRKCSTQVGSSIDGKSSAEAAGKETKKGTDVDRDGLKHEVEDQLGTDPCHWDSDADGLADPWEVSGVPGAGFDLNGDGSAEVTRDQVFGASDPPDPLFKDVYVEADMYDCAKGGCPLGDPMTHEIDPQAMSDVMMMFDTIPAPNPAGAGTGIDLHLQDGEHIKHAPNCDQPPLANRGPNFGTPDQRANPQIIQAKALAYRYLVASHSTLFDDSADCSASIFSILPSAWSADSPLPAFDNTPFGRAEINGPDIALSLGPVFICPRAVSTCDRGHTLGIFPTTLIRSAGGIPFTEKLAQPLYRLLGTSERSGIIQLQGRAIAHLLGHSLGLDAEEQVVNDPARHDALPAGETYWPPDRYRQFSTITYANSLHGVQASGDHLTYPLNTAITYGPIENDVFDELATPPPRARTLSRQAAAGSLLDTDRDGDGVVERVDNCVGVANPGQEDLDRDGIGDACDADLDDDGTPNATDAFPADTDNDGIPNASDPDDDNDGVADAADNCALSANAAQHDVDGDGAGDACDADSDADGFADGIELQVGSNRLDAASKPEWVGQPGTCSDGLDNDGDGRTDAADGGCVDGDGDGIPDERDLCPAAADVGNDLDGDGLGDECDPDADGDGFPAAQEAALGSNDRDAHSTPEATEIAGSCADGRDNDLDGETDGQDLRCQATVGLHAIRPGFDSTSFPGNDDGSTGPVPLGFSPNFFGTTYHSLFVNNNGNVTFDEPLGTFTPFDLTSTSRAIVAPYFADVDTRSGASATVHYGTGTVNGHPAFGVTWPGVGCYSFVTSVRNNFQVILVDRSEVGAGDFDIEFDYDQIQWETGQASGGNFQCQGGSSSRVGFAKGTSEPGTFFELPGSGVPGAFLDSNAANGLIHGSANSPVLGRYVYAVRNGTPQPVGDTDSDGVLDEADNCPSTANPGQADADLDGIGDACSSPDIEHTTAGFLQAGLDGSTSVEPAPVRLGDEPPLDERLVRIVRFRLDAGLATDAEALTHDLVDSLVEAGLVPASGAAALEAGVLAQLDSTPPVVTVAFPAPDGANGWFKHSPVVGSVRADDPGDVASITCTGATVGALTGVGTPTATAPLTVTGEGPHTVSCTATDGIGNHGAAGGSVATATLKIDSTAPAVTCSATPSSLWPPNHKLVAVTTTVAVAGGLSGSAGFTLVSATSSEPDNGQGDGDTANDVQGWTVGTPDVQGQLRAERSGNGTGRTYTLTYRGTDGAGNAATCAALVKVPHDQGH